MATSKKELIEIMYKGYCSALDSCFDNKNFYIKGFLDGMKYQKDGTILESNLDKMLEKLEND